MIIMGIVTFGILVTIHEFGHFWVARRCGVKVVCFSVGFGKSLLRWRDKQGTEYVIAMIPLGGYVRMIDEREGEVAEENLPYAFNRQSVWARIAIVAAGPLANFILAVVAYWLVFSAGITGVAPVIKTVEPGSIAAEAGLEPGQEIVSVDGEQTNTWRSVMEQLLFRIGDSGIIHVGVQYPGSDLIYDLKLPIQQWLSEDEAPDLAKSLGFALGAPKVPVRLAEVMPDSAAQMAGLRSNDLITSANGEVIDNWQQWVALVRDSANSPIALTVERGGQPLDLTLSPKSVTLGDGQVIGRAGVTLKRPDDFFRQYSFTAFGALVEAVNKTWEMSVFTLESMGKLITGQISSKNLSGPITIAKVASDSAESGVQNYVTVLALLSISLGVLNLLPIPVLDGGHLLYYSVEAITGKPVSDRVQQVGTQLGIMLVLSVMVLALYNDIMRL